MYWKRRVLPIERKVYHRGLTGRFSLIFKWSWARLMLPRVNRDFSGIESGSVPTALFRKDWTGIAVDDVFSELDENRILVLDVTMKKGPRCSLGNNSIFSRSMEEKRTDQLYYVVYPKTFNKGRIYYVTAHQERWYPSGKIVLIIDLECGSYEGRQRVLDLALVEKGFLCGSKERSRSVIITDDYILYTPYEIH